MSENMRKKGLVEVKQRVQRADGKSHIQTFWKRDPNAKNQNAELARKHVESMQKKRRNEERETALRATRAQRELFDEYHEPAMRHKAASNRLEALKQKFEDGLIVDADGNKIDLVKDQEFDVPGIGVIKPNFQRNAVGKKFDAQLAYRSLTDEQLAMLPKGNLNQKTLKELDPEIFVRFSNDDYDSPTLTVIGDTDAEEAKLFGDLPGETIEVNDFITSFANAKVIERDTKNEMDDIRSRMFDADVFGDQLRGAQDGEETDGVTISYPAKVDWDAIVREGVRTEEQLDNYRDKKVRKGDLDKVFGKEFGAKFQVESTSTKALINLPRQKKK